MKTNFGLRGNDRKMIEKQTEAPIPLYEKTDFKAKFIFTII
jgi:hypothetical protein